MAKIVKKIRKRRIKLEGLATSLFVLTLLVSLASSLFLRTYNVSLSKEKQDTQKRIQTVMVENDAIKVQVQNLSSADKVMAVANENGMTFNQDNIVTVNSGE